MYRGGGSIGIIAATRSTLLIAKCPHEPNLRVIAQVKSNLGPLAPSLLFEPVTGPDGVVQIEWRGECDYTPEDLLSLMDRYNIAEALVHDHHARTSYPREAGNRRIVQLTQGQPRLHPVWVVEPPKK